MLFPRGGRSNPTTGVGRMDRKVTIQQRSGDTQDANGNLTPNYAKYKDWWCAIEPLRGREFFEAQAVNAETTLRFRGRFVSGVTEDMRIKDADGNVYDITYIPPDRGTNRHEMEIMAKHTGNEAV